MKNKIFKFFLVSTVYVVLGTIFGYVENIHSFLLPIFIMLYIVINVFLMEKSKKFIENFLTFSGLVCLGFIVAIFFKDSYKPIIFQYLGLMFVSSLLIYYLKKNYSISV